MPTLVVVRHAKSDWSHALSDIDRPLAERGRRDAPAIGTWLARHVPPITLVLCSPAKRARQTWRLAAERLDPAPPVRYDERLHTAGPADLVGVIEELPDDEPTVALVGHNPGLSELVALLSGEPVELKTSAVAVLAWPGSWADVHSRAATLEAFTTARG